MPHDAAQRHRQRAIGRGAAGCTAQRAADRSQETAYRDAQSARHAGVVTGDATDSSTAGAAGDRFRPLSTQPTPTTLTQQLL